MSEPKHFLRLSSTELTVLALALIAIAAAIIVGFVSANDTSLTHRSNVSLTITRGGLSKDAITISPGTTVTWKNNDSTEHSVMREHEHSDRAHAATTKDNVDPDVFSSPALEPGESYSFTFKESGTTHYHDSFHPTIRGKIVVTE